MLNALTTFAQDTLDYTNFTTLDNGDAEAAAAGLAVGVLIPIILVSVALGVISIIGLWKIFTKAGKPGWAAIIPIYNTVVLLQVVGRPIWWILLLFLGFIPFVGYIIAFVVGIIIMNDLAKSFGKDVSYTILLVLLPFIGLPMLGLGSAKYRGPAALGNGGGTKPAAKARA